MENRDPVVKFPHRILREKAGIVAPEEIASPKIQRLISNMKKILSVAPDGVGLAAPQVGASLRIFIVSEEAMLPNANTRIDANDANTRRQWEYFVFINPVLKKKSKSRIAMPEGCLSVPGKFGEVVRSEKVFLEWLDERGKKHGRGFTKFFARVIQHEMDHLEGILIGDRARKLISVADAEKGKDAAGQ